MRAICPRCKGSLRQDDSIAPPDWCCMMCGWRAEQRLKALHPGLYLIYAVVGDSRLPMHWLFHHGSNGYRCERHTVPGTVGLLGCPCIAQVKAFEQESNLKNRERFRGMKDSWMCVTCGDRPQGTIHPPRCDQCAVCLEEGCESLSTSRGRCGKHSQRFKARLDAQAKDNKALLSSLQ